MQLIASIQRMWQVSVFWVSPLSFYHFYFLFLFCFFSVVGEDVRQEFVLLHRKWSFFYFFILSFLFFSSISGGDMRREFVLLHRKWSLT